MVCPPVLFSFVFLSYRFRFGHNGCPDRHTGNRLSLPRTERPYCCTTSRWVGGHPSRRIDDAPGTPYGQRRSAPVQPAEKCGFLLFRAGYEGSGSYFYSAGGAAPFTLNGHFFPLCGQGEELPVTPVQQLSGVVAVLNCGCQTVFGCQSPLSCQTEPDSDEQIANSNHKADNPFCRWLGCL